MTGGLPDWQPFALDSGEAMPVELSGMEGPALVLLAAPAVDEAGWAVRAAARIAGQRSRRNARLVLADLDLQQPRLHMQVGADNGEGVSDVILWGASLPRVARPTEHGFVFAPAGTAVADSRRVLESDRWEAILGGFDEAEAELFLYVPWEAPGRDALLSWARNVVVLAAHAEVDRLEPLAVDGLRIGALLGPEEDHDPSGRHRGEATEGRGTPESPAGEATASDEGGPGSPEGDVEDRGAEPTATGLPPPSGDTSDSLPGIPPSNLRVKDLSPRLDLGPFPAAAAFILFTAVAVFLGMGQA
jgi:hypothetical protein